MTARVSGALAVLRSSVAVSNSKPMLPLKDWAQRLHRLPGPRPGVTGVEEHEQAAVVPSKLDAVLDEHREVDRLVRCRLGRVCRHEVEVPAHLVGELAVADVRQDQGGAGLGRFLDGRLDRDLGLVDRRVEEQAGRAAFERDADALARARMDQQRVEALGDLRQEVQPVEDLALRPDDQEAALGHAKAPF